MPLPSAIWPNYCCPLTLKIFLPYGYFLKKSTQHSNIWHWAVLRKKKQDGGRIKICESFSGNSLKEDISVYTTFDPCYFSWDSPFNEKMCRMPHHWNVILTILYIIIIVLGFFGNFAIVWASLTSRVRF